MKLLCFIDSLGSGGAQRQMLAIAEHMIQKGHEVNVAWYIKNDFYKDRFEEIGVKCIYKEANKFSERICFFTETVKKTDPDAILAFMLAQAVIASIYKWLTIKKRKLVISMRSNNEKSFMSYKRKFVRPLYIQANKIVCNSYAEAEVWQKHCRYLKKKIIVIPNYVNIQEKKGVLLNKYDDGIIKIIVPANLRSEIKNPLNVAKALFLMTENERKKIRIDWYGKRYDKDKLNPICETVEKYIQEHGLSQSFITHDETKDIYEAMNKADVVALFSTEEGLPNAICEGMMMGKPVMMTKVSDWEKLISENGIVCEGTDPTNIANALRKAIKCKENGLEKMGEKSYIIAQSLFDESKITSQWESVFILQNLNQRGEDVCK